MDHDAPQNISYDPTDVQNWYDDLKDCTFPTWFLRISEEEAQCIVDFYDDKRHHSNKIDEHKQKILDDLESKVQALIDKCEGSGAFVRLSTRSPKDVALKRTERTKKLLDQELQDLNAGNDLTLQVIAVIRCAVRCLKVDNAKEAMDFILHSERTYQDLFGMLLRTGGSNKWDMQIVVRKWVPIRPEYEFRGFVYNKKLNGLTQYYKACFVPEMAKRKKEIQKLIVDFFESVKDRIKVDHFVVDFAVEGQKVYLIELNTFGTTASPGLFDWKTDAQLLKEGPLDFRVLSARPQNVKQQIARPLRALMGWSDEPEPTSDRNCMVQ